MAVLQESFDFCRRQCPSLLFPRWLGHADSAFPVSAPEGVSVGVAPRDGGTKDSLQQHQNVPTSFRLHLLRQRWQEITLDSCRLNLMDQVVFEERFQVSLNDGPVPVHRRGLQLASFGYSRVLLEPVIAEFVEADRDRLTVVTITHFFAAVVQKGFRILLSLEGPPLLSTAAVRSRYPDGRVVSLLTLFRRPGDYSSSTHRILLLVGEFTSAANQKTGDLLIDVDWKIVT